MSRLQNLLVLLLLVTPTILQIANPGNHPFEHTANIFAVLSTTFCCR